MECYCYLRNVQDLLAGGKTPYERRFGEPFRGPIIHFGAMVHGREKGTEEDGGTVRDTKENASGQDGVIDFRGKREENVGIAPSPQQPQGKSKRHLQEEHQGEHQGVRSQPEDHASRGRLGGGLRDLTGDYEECDVRDRGGRHVVRGSVRGHGGA